MNFASDITDTIPQFNLDTIDANKKMDLASKIVKNYSLFKKAAEHKMSNAAQSVESLMQNTANSVPPSGDLPSSINSLTSAIPAISSLNVALTVPVLPFSPGLNNKIGLPTSQLVDVYGVTYGFQIAYAVNTALDKSITRQNYAHLPDIQGVLQQEIAAAYRFLAQPECADLWTQFCHPDLVAAIRTRKQPQIDAYRSQYEAAVAVITNSPAGPDPDSRAYSVTAALAWGILVDSALLNDRLVEDMREVTSAQGKAFPWCGQWLPYYLPVSPPDARQAFNEYVRIRWPIHVFALDPMSEDQNLADSLSTRRETQLALSIAFTNGIINANQLTRYTRRLEAEYETIALNRTQVGFGHGPDTFGWRFYPRFQTPPTESNLTTLVRDQLIGGPGPNALLRNRRLEPGPRECVAVVMMPSFVPYVELDTVSNWFSLATPKHKVLDHTQALKMSRTVRTLQNCGYNVTDAECYRPGEFERMIRRIDQLEARLPTQTQTVQVPVINTLGGFEMFSNGTTDLAPELYGWYGVPGVQAGKQTVLYLVGDHFSPLHTNAIVGNQKAIVRLLSRQVAEVTVAASAIPLDGTAKVQAQIATPYGVSRELIIPVVGLSPAASTSLGYTMKTDKVYVTYRLAPDWNRPGTYIVGSVRAVDPANIIFSWRDSSGSIPSTLHVRFRFKWNGGEVKEWLYARTVRGNSDEEFMIPVEEIKRIAAEVAFATTPNGIPVGEPPFSGSMTTTEIQVAPLEDGVHAVQWVPVSNQLTLNALVEYDDCLPLPNGVPCTIPPAARRAVGNPTDAD